MNQRSKYNKWNDKSTEGNSFIVLGLRKFLYTCHKTKILKGMKDKFNYKKYKPNQFYRLKYQKQN